MSVVIVKTVLVWNFLSSSKSSCLNSYSVSSFFKETGDNALNDGATTLGRVCFTEYGTICRVSILEASPTDSCKSEYWPS